MNACGILIPENLASLGSPYVAMHYAGNEARRHISTHRARAVVDALRMDTGHALDVGCGPGFSSVLLAKKISAVTALDIDAAKLGIAREMARLNGVSLDLVLGDASKPIPFPDDHFDGLISLELIEHIRDWESLAGEMCRVVRPGGRVAISTPGRYGLAQIIKTSMIRTGLFKVGTYEWFIPRGKMIRRLRECGISITSVEHVVFTAPMLPDPAMPLVKQVEGVCERVPGLRRLCSTTIYCGEKRAGRES